jgi:hypothetical protein
MLIDEIRNIRSTRSELRKFGLAVGLVISGIGGILFFTKGFQTSAYFLAVGVTLILLGLSLPAILLPVQKIWMTLAVVLGWIMTRVILSLLFFLIVTPIGLLTRVFGGSFLEVKWRETRNSYWNHRSPKPFEKKNLERQF